MSVLSVVVASNSSKQWQEIILTLAPWFEQEPVGLVVSDKGTKAS